MKKLLKMFYENFTKTDTIVLANNLTYVSLFAIFPFLAIVLGFSKGFGLDVLLLNKLKDYLINNEQLLDFVLSITDKFVKTLNSNLLSGLGILIMIWSIINLFMILEKSFNMIWHTKMKRSLSKSLVNYIAIIFLIPIVIVILIVTNDKLLDFLNVYLHLGNYVIFMTKLIKFILLVLFLSFMYYIIPSTKVSYRYSLLSAVIIVIVLYILSSFYTVLQSSISNYNAIYGSLAFVPLFLVWVKYFWILILTGSQISYCLDNNNFNVKKLPIKYEKEIGLYVYYMITKRFLENEKPYDINSLNKETGITKNTLLICLEILEELEFIQIIEKQDEKPIFQISKNPDITSIKEYFDKFEKRGDLKEDIFESVEKKLKYYKLINKIKYTGPNLIKDLEEDK